ncbi:MAG: hypothetical protein HRU15_02160 [Planctomycetes bacterium]|nr:hypothetical protein [Planctomycetota bacterium]
MDTPEDPGPPPTPTWVVTFTDMMSLLLTFFILLLTYSTPKVEKLFDLRGSIEGTFGIFTDAKDDRDSFVEPNPMLVGRDQHNPYAPSLVPRFRPIEEHEPNKVIKRLKNQEMNDELLIDRIDEGYRIRIADTVQFQHGARNMTTLSFNKIAKVAKAIEFMPYHLVIVAHVGGAELPLLEKKHIRPTDLSIERAVGIAERLHKRFGIDRRIIGVAAYGAQAGDTGAGYVEFILSDNSYFAERW